MKAKTNYAISDEVKIHLEKLHLIVKNSIEAEELIVHNLAHPDIENLTKGEKISDRVAQFGGSWKFIISFFVILIVWIIFNVLAMGTYKFDPYPFILMNLILSCLAALQAPIIMMSQNRQEQKDRIRSENDYLINLKAEMQIRSLNQKIDLLLEEEIKTLFDVQQKQYDLLKSINSKLTVKK
ncbi:hypothetical protein FNO01nite_17640 [Flavobacterium noncentrifugens]|uniref:Cyclic nucleotide-binding protein n=1 Tax=Flavobacterium noncentrifugens TaxID=1128970 RepID=A0A1G8WY55_9FLAO|nr:DUF1003 domain-containing protein [Flavobacterium noncentrifugens]GEP51092.1 hypothetical protein FNO01nite_17640 [Flavobacterium noncentrifugens]SDJ83144.1 Protein of unknown function [Flavobacterium noncentrifugens]